jgi:hypothetical protein
MQLTVFSRKTVWEFWNSELAEWLNMLVKYTEQKNTVKQITTLNAVTNIYVFLQMSYSVLHVGYWTLPFQQRSMNDD